MSESYLQGRVIAVTGASKGLGLAAATSLVARGARVALLARNAAWPGKMFGAATNPVTLEPRDLEFDPRDPGRGFWLYRRIAHYGIE